MSTLRTIGFIAILLLAAASQVQAYGEAPVLAAKVAKGELPPVEQRLPEEPMIVEPVEEIGQYGGTWRRAWFGPSDSSGPSRITYESLLRWDREGLNVIPGIAKSWEFSEDGKSLTLFLRKGMKWSDGAPFTADDIMFWYEDMLLNDELTPAKPTWFMVNGELGKVYKLDDYTVRLEFSAPYGILEGVLALNGVGMFAPKHYLKQFHPKYVDPTVLNEMAKAAGFEFWYQLFAQKNNWIENTELPTIRAWKPINAPTSEKWVMERNPYYWKVDPAGNQLPYIDKVVHTLVRDKEVLNLKAIAGELDFQLRHIDIQNYPVLLENKDRNGYRVLAWKPALGADPMFTPNLNIADPILSKLFNNRKFRIALSVAINRDEINNLLYYGLGTPRAATAIPGAPGYRPEFERMYAQYDPALANKLLDEIGLTERNSEGYRLTSNGKPLTVTLEVVSAFGPWVKVSELVADYWRSIGIKANVKTLERALFFERVAAGQHEIAVWNMDRALNFLVNPVRFVPLNPHGARFAPLYAIYVSSNGKSGVEPTGDIKRVIELYEQAKTELDPDKREKLASEILRINVENVWSIGTVGMTPSTMGLGVAKNNFRNVPESAISDVDIQSPGNTDPCQYFFKQE